MPRVSVRPVVSGKTPRPHRTETDLLPPLSVIWPLRCRGTSVRMLTLGEYLARHRPEKERRRWPRLPLAIPVFVRGCDDKGQEFLEFATTLNISAGGALVAVRRSLPPSSRVMLEIPSAPLAATASLPRAARTLRARTVRVTHTDGYHMLGLKFARPLLRSNSKATLHRRKLSSVV